MKLSQSAKWAVPAGVLAAAAIVAGGVWAVNNGLQLAPAKITTKSCDTIKKTIPVVLTADSPPHEIRAHQCDQLAFTNQTGDTVELAVGPHDHHIEYPGFEESATYAGGTESMVLRETGYYEIHDHIKDQLEVKLNVLN